MTLDAIFPEVNIWNLVESCLEPKERLTCLAPELAPLRNIPEDTFDAAFHRLINDLKDIQKSQIEIEYSIIYYIPRIQWFLQQEKYLQSVIKNFKLQSYDTFPKSNHFTEEITCLTPVRYADVLYNILRRFPISDTWRLCKYLSFPIAQYIQAITDNNFEEFVAIFQWFPDLIVREPFMKNYKFIRCSKKHLQNTLVCSIYAHGNLQFIKFLADRNIMPRIQAVETSQEQIKQLITPGDLSEKPIKPSESFEKTYKISKDSHIIMKKQFLPTSESKYTSEPEYTLQTEYEELGYFCLISHLVYYFNKDVQVIKLLLEQQVIMPFNTYLIIGNIYENMEHLIYRNLQKNPETYKEKSLNSDYILYVIEQIGEINFHTMSKHISGSKNYFWHVSTIGTAEQIDQLSKFTTHDFYEYNLPNTRAYLENPHICAFNRFIKYLPQYELMPLLRTLRNKGNQCSNYLEKAHSIWKKLNQNTENTENTEKKLLDCSFIKHYGSITANLDVCKLYISKYMEICYESTVSRILIILLDVYISKFIKEAKSKELAARLFEICKYLATFDAVKNYNYIYQKFTNSELVIYYNLGLISYNDILQIISKNDLTDELISTVAHLEEISEYFLTRYKLPVLRYSMEKKTSLMNRLVAENYVWQIDTDYKYTYETLVRHINHRLASKQLIHFKNWRANFSGYMRADVYNAIKQAVSQIDDKKQATKYMNWLDSFKIDI